MSDCLWVDIDDYIESAISTDMGAATYGTLEIATILVGETVDPRNHTLPLALIRSYGAEYGEPHPQADENLHFDGITYPYELIVVGSSATAAQAKADAQEWLRRLREMIRSRIAFGGLQADDGEIVRFVEIARGAVQVRGRTGGAGEYQAEALLEIEVITQI